MCVPPFHLATHWSLRLPMMSKRSLSAVVCLGIMIPLPASAQGFRAPALPGPRQTSHTAAAKVDPPQGESIVTPPAVPKPPDAGTTPSDRTTAPPAARGPMTLDEFELIAWANNPTLAQAAAKIDAMRGKWVQDGLCPNPKVLYKGDEMGNEGKSGFQGWAISQELVTGNKLGLSRAVADQQVRQAQFDRASQEWRVLNDVRIQFYSVLLAQRSVELNLELHKVAQAVAKTARDLHTAQEVSKIDVLQTKIEADTVQIQAAKSRQAYLSAWRKLISVIGTPDLPPTYVSGNLNDAVSDLQWETALHKILSGSPELCAAYAKAEGARLAVQRAYAERHPNIEVEVGRSHDNIAHDDVTNVMVAVPLPIFNRNQGNIQQAQSELMAAQADIERLSLELRQRLAGVFERYATARDQVTRYEKDILPSADESLKLVNAGYRAGETPFTTVLTAQRTYLQAQTAHLDALRELRETSILIEGLLLMDSLQGGK